MRTAVAIAALVLVLAGCAPVGTRQTPGPTPPGGLWLTAAMEQAIPPGPRFAWLPALAITTDRVVVTPGAVPAIYPGPLVPPLVGRAISPAGIDAIVDWARNLGLLGERTDFTGDPAAPGASRGRIRLWIDGAVRELVGDPSRLMQCVQAPCGAAPGTPEAFAVFWQRLVDLPTLLPGELGTETEWPPAGYALLVGPPPVPEAGIRPDIADWPLEVRLATIGAPVADGTARCAIVRGDEAAILGPALRDATQITRWAQDPGAAEAFGLEVRPLLPGEDPCLEQFGVRTSFLGSPSPA